MLICTTGWSHMEGEINTGFDPVTKIRRSTPVDNHSNSNWFTSRYMEWSWELIFTSHKPNELKGTETIHALYGAKKYYRDVTPLLLSNLLQDGSIVIPAKANFNELFSDVMYNTEKILIIHANGKEYKLPETRSSDTLIRLHS